MNRDVKRIVLTGPECTGKTSLAVRLAAELDIPLVSESARAYASDAGRALTVTDVEKIAKQHLMAEDAAGRRETAALVLDTDLLSTVVYGKHYYGFRSEWLEREARTRLGTVYLLCHPDIPWVSDGIRDRPEGRWGMLEEFRTVLGEFGVRYAEITGVGEARIAAARMALAT